MANSRFKITGTGGSQLLETISLLNALPKNLEKNSRQAAQASVGKVVSEARNNFEQSTLRPSSHGNRPQDRETTNFTFGGSGAFIGRTFQERENVWGFGFPVIDQADAATNRVWRSLEHGLSGTENAPWSLGLFAEYPQGSHLLPNSFAFDGPEPDGVMSLGRRGGSGARRSDEDRAGKGIAGKHFIEEAWIQQRPFIGKRYKESFVAAMGTIK